MICNGTVQDSQWTLLLDMEAEPKPGEAIPLSRWLSLKDSGHALTNIGVVLEGDDDISDLEAHILSIPIVALHIPKFTDGRSYSHAYRLKRVWRYTGSLLAFGDVLRDQLIYMARCGIDSFYMREDQDLEAALASFGLYDGFYQYNHL
jgi:uncharacterized protein (DUF934 family)